MNTSKWDIKIKLAAKYGKMEFDRQNVMWKVECMIFMKWPPSRVGSLSDVNISIALLVN